jgi:hypothetical protein
MAAQTDFVVIWMCHRISITGRNAGTEVMKELIDFHRVLRMDKSRVPATEKILSGKMKYIQFIVFTSAITQGEVYCLLKGLSYACDKPGQPAFFKQDKIIRIKPRLLGCIETEMMEYVKKTATPGYTAGSCVPAVSQEKQTDGCNRP